MLSNIQEIKARQGKVIALVSKGDDTIYVQASYLITEESTFEREFGNLKKINDNYPKYVISMTPFLDSSKYEGILHVPLAKFLKKGLS